MNALAALILLLAFWLFVPLSIPFRVPDLEYLKYCDSHSGLATIHATMLDLVKHQGTVACNDGTVRWVKW